MDAHQDRLRAGPSFDSLPESDGTVSPLKPSVVALPSNNFVRLSAELEPSTVGIVSKYIVHSPLVGLDNDPGHIVC